MALGVLRVVGLNFDFVLLNLTKHSSYLIYNASLYFSPTIQNQYFQNYGYDQETSSVNKSLYIGLLLSEMILCLFVAELLIYGSSFCFVVVVAWFEIHILQGQHIKTRTNFLTMPEAHSMRTTENSVHLADDHVDDFVDGDGDGDDVDRDDHVPPTL
ncbi:hypothetical protein RIF29_11210 [Crotalaria pallida]|uniref:Uncharacterized protein n=1 Tax=Crotalaria pallida TaxID=3830 RepID=A0AAN9P0K1_CROPI